MSIATILAFVIRYRRWFAYGAAALAVILALWAAYNAIYDAGVTAERGKWEERQRAAEAKARADEKALQEAFAQIDNEVTLDIGAIHEVRTVYRDRVRTVAVAADRPDCVIADSLRAQINAAASEYARAAGAGN